MSGKLQGKGKVAAAGFTQPNLSTFLSAPQTQRPSRSSQTGMGKMELNAFCHEDVSMEFPGEGANLISEHPSVQSHTYLADK